MAQVIYEGKYPTCRVKIGGAVISRWARGETIEIDDSELYRLEGNKDFRVLTTSDKKVVKEEVKFDLDGDGDFDSDDVTIAAKAMSAHKYKKSKNEEE